MADAEVPARPPGRVQERGPGGLGRWALNALPFLLLGGLAIAGISWTSLVGKPSRTYWVMFVPVAAVICVITGWRVHVTGSAKARLVLTQALQWAAVWIAMYLTMLNEVAGLLNDDAIGLILLVLTALSVFISGLYERVWQLCVVGVLLAAAVPMIAWVDRGALILLVIALLLLALGLGNWWLRRKAI